jgi:hypothetical protein
MKKLPPIHGLLREAKRKELQATREATESRSQKKCPRTAHDLGVSAEKLAVEAAGIRSYCAETADIILQIEAVCDFIGTAPRTSAHRTIALRHLEDAAMRLRRELGDEPPLEAI